MGIRERTWTWKGKAKSAWVCRVLRPKGKRRLKTFKTKREAEDFGPPRASTSSAACTSPTATASPSTEAGQLWIETGKENGLVRSSLEQCRSTWTCTSPRSSATMKLSKLDVPAIRAFEGDLRANGRSPALTKKVLSSLGGIIADAQERGLAMHNPVREMRASREQATHQGARASARRSSSSGWISRRRPRSGPS